MRCIPIWATARWAPRSMAAMSPLHTPLQEWRPGGNHHHQGFRAVAAVGAVRGHGPGAGRNPPLSCAMPSATSMCSFGRKILEKVFADEGRELTDKAIGEVAKKLRLAKAEDVYADVGRGALRGRRGAAGGVSRTQARRQGRQARPVRRRQAHLHPRPDRRHFLQSGPMLPSAAGRPHRRHR